jgi:hypothetical protein
MWLLGGVEIRTTDTLTQSFVLSSAKGKSACPVALQGVLLQSVDDDTSLMINKTQITLTGSGSALISVPPTGGMTVRLLDGKGIAKIGDKSTTLDKSDILSIPLDKKGEAALPTGVNEVTANDQTADLLSLLPLPNDDAHRAQPIENTVEPMSGRWKSSSDDLTHTCTKNPYGDTLVPSERIFRFNVPFTIWNYVEQASTVLPITHIEFSHPGPNHYKWHWQQGKFRVDNDMVIISPKQMKLINSLDFGNGCVVTLNVKLEWIGEK